MRLSRFRTGIVATLVAASPALAAPDEEQLGKSAGYPLGTRATWFFDESVRVGSFSNLDKIFPHNTLKKPASPAPLPAASSVPPLTYRFDERTLTIEDFLNRQRITGLLIIKDGEVLFERYQYDRRPEHRFVSHSMAKSGVAFKEDYSGKDDLWRFNQIRYTQGTIPALRAFIKREAPEGSRFHYATSETAILSVLIKAVTGKTLSEFLTEKLWQPVGAQSDATWVRGIDGLDDGGGSFTATLRDYGRLGVLLANDGAIWGKQIVPKAYLLEATDWRKQPAAFAPGKATPYFGYGYKFWLFPGEKRRFALLGVYGQSIFLDPALKLVVVITAAAKNASVGKETLARERDALWRGLVAKYGSW